MCRKCLFLISLLVILCWACTLYATVVTTADGNGADTFVTNDETNDKDSVMGTEKTLEIRNYEGVQQRIGYLRFDISSVEVDGDHYIGGDLTGATLTLSVTGTQEKWVSVYGVVDGVDDLWDEATLSYNTAPGVLSDPPTGRPVLPGRYALNDALLQKLGQIQLGTSGLYSSDPNTLNLDYFLAQDTNKLITFIIINEQSDPEADWWITTKESDTPELAPALNFPNAVEPLKVIWVYDTINDDINNVQSDQFWIDWLVAAEYALDAEPDKWTELDTAKIAVLNDADLIIFSLTSDSNAYADDANEIADWASVTTPVLNMEDWEQSEAGLQLFAEAINKLTEQPKVCTVDVIPPVLPAVSDLPSIPKLPDPFKFMDGKRMTHLDDWTCRRSEISLLVQEYVYGPKPPQPSSVTGSYSDEQLTVNCSENGKSISFTVRITYPPTGTAPYPAIITIGPWLTLPKTELDNLGIAVIYFPNDEIASQVSASARGRGKFYDLYGSDHQAGSLMAWSWGLSRLIDVLEQTPEANINPVRLGVTGCSRNGKGALVCGAFDERIALTIPTESGAGGASSWRVADALVAAGGNVQTARQIVTENTWMAPVFAQFGNRVDRLPVDQHMVAALCAPRPLLITENTAFEWLGPEACYTTAIAAHKVWEALGVPDRMGFVQTSHGDHCVFKEIEELRAFCTKFLLDGQADTSVLKTDGNFDLNPSDWINWDVPLLEEGEMPLVYEVENTGADCPEPPLPSFNELPTIESLPNPFEWSDSDRGRINSRADWRCRRAEIAAELQHYELGTKPDPPSNLEASFSDGLLTVTLEEGGNSLTLTAAITIPDGDGPFPAVIGVGFTGAGSLPPDIFTSRGIATVQFNFGEIAPVWPGRGEGAFYDLYPDPKVGSFIGWAWGISRIIDGLEKTPEANIDLKHLAVTGCSFAGKIALFAGAFDERIALTIAQESGGGGDAAWRVSETLSGNRETLRNAQGVAWYYQDLRQFNNAVTKLPYDHHELMAMVAPRALFVLGNPDMEYLASESGHVACKAAHEVWKALGVPDRFGFSYVGGHGHCQLPDSQKPEVVAFVEKFLLGDESTNTDISTSLYNTDLSRWITWDTPELK